MKRTTAISLSLAVLAAMAFAASSDDKPRPADDDTTSAANRRGWPETDEMVVGRLAIRDHGLQQGAHVLSVIVELKNRSGHALEMEFDPHDLHIEMFNSDGDPIEEDVAQDRSGPIPMSHRMTISADAYAGVPTHRGGVGLPVGKAMLAAGWQVWTLPPGKYTMKGTAKITAEFGSAVLDSGLPSRNFRAKNNDFPPVGKTKSVSVELQAASFQVDAINSKEEAAATKPSKETSDGRWSEAVNGLQARLALVEKEPRRGRRWLVPYLELRNVRDLMNAMEVECRRDRLKIELVDKDGQPLRSGRLMPRSGPHVELGMLTLPFDSSCRVSLECTNWGLGGAATVATDSGAWSITKEENGKVFLRATLTGDEGKPESKTWHGELRTPLIPVTWADGDQPIH